MERVMEELNWEISRPYEYYFRHHLKKMRKEKEIWTLKASRDYRREKAEKLSKENEYYKRKLKYTELTLKIWLSDRPDLYKQIRWDTI